MKISYFSKHNKDGTHYNQGISMTQKEFDIIKDSINT